MLFDAPFCVVLWHFVFSVVVERPSEKPFPAFQTASAAMLEHLREMYDFYGETAGLRIARKHIGWYLAPFPDGEACRKHINTLDSAAAQYDAVSAFLERQEQGEWPSEKAV